jgi:hypothetical protein
LSSIPSQLIRVTQGIIDKDENLGIYDLHVTCNGVADNGLYIIQITSPDPWRFTFRTWSFDKYPELVPHPRAHNPLYQARYAMNGSTGEIDPDHNMTGVTDVVSHVYPARRPYFIANAKQVTMTMKDGERLETPIVVMLVSPGIIQEEDKAQLVTYLLYALCRSNQMFALC